MTFQAAYKYLGGSRGLIFTASVNLSSCNICASKCFIRQEVRQYDDQNSSQDINAHLKSYTKNGNADRKEAPFLCRLIALCILTAYSFNFIVL